MFFNKKILRFSKNVLHFRNDFPNFPAAPHAILTSRYSRSFLAWFQAKVESKKLSNVFPITNSSPILKVKRTTLALRLTFLAEFETLAVRIQSKTCV